MVLLLVGCSTKARYQSTGKIPVAIGPRALHHDQAKKTFELEYYLFGQYPSVHVINLDEQFMDAGFYSMANIRIHEYRSLSQYFSTIFSLGLYSPFTVELSGFGIKGERDD